MGDYVLLDWDHFIQIGTWNLQINDLGVFSDGIFGSIVYCRIQNLAQ